MCQYFEMKNFKWSLIFFGFLLFTSTQGQTPEKVAGTETAILAGGCFWCMQPPYDSLKSEGILETIVGYTGGHIKNPTYKQVSEGSSGHREVIKIVFDPQKISFEKILEIFWRNVDPFDKSGQFCDKGFQYSSAIYFTNEPQQTISELSKNKLGKQFPNQQIETKIEKASEFYPAEDYHQSYYTKNPVRYKYYRYSCGRDKRLTEIYGKSAK